MKLFLFFGFVIGLTVLLSGIAFLFGFGLHVLGDVIEQPKSAEAFRKNLQKTSLFDIFVGGDVPNITTDTATEDEIIIPGIRRGNRLYVDVEINDERTVTLVVDTGATDIALASKVAYELGLSKGESREATYNTAHGPVQQYITTLETVRIGDVVHHNVRASFGEHLNGRSRMDGLLGMSILKYYMVNIDLAREELHLIPRQT